MIWLGLLTPLILYGNHSLRRPERDAIARQPLFEGITYSRRVADRPRPQITHIFNIDLTAPGLEPFVTPAYPGADLSKPGPQKRETLAQETSQFLQAQGLQLAVNANFFYKFREVAPWNYYPRPGQPVNLVGVAISEGDVVSQVNPNDSTVPALCFTPQQAAIHSDGTCPARTQQAVAGNLMLLENGQLTERVKKKIVAEGDKSYPFTVAALDTSGTRLWLVLVDGKQPLYTEGATLKEITQLVQTLGADVAIRLDGGGSTTGAVATPEGPEVLNVPIQTKIPTKERPVANHLGFFANPLQGTASE